MPLELVHVPFPEKLHDITKVIFVGAPRGDETEDQGANGLRWKFKAQIRTAADDVLNKGVALRPGPSAIEMLIGITGNGGFDLAYGALGFIKKVSISAKCRNMKMAPRVRSGFLPGRFLQLGDEWRIRTELTSAGSQRQRLDSVLFEFSNLERRRTFHEAIDPVLDGWEFG
jgi:hypothetical protein